MGDSPEARLTHSSAQHLKIISDMPEHRIKALQCIPGEISDLVDFIEIILVRVPIMQACRGFTRNIYFRVGSQLGIFTVTESVNSANPGKLS